MHRYNQIAYLLQQINPSVYTEVGMVDPEWTADFIKLLSNNNKKVVYFGIGSEEKINALKTILTEVDFSNVDLVCNFILPHEKIELDREYEFTDLNQLPQKTSLLDTEFLFCGELDSPDDYLACIENFSFVPNIVLDKFINVQKNEFPHDGVRVNSILHKFQHKILPLIDNTIHNGKVLPIQLVFTGSNVNEIELSKETSMGIAVKPKKAIPDEELLYNIKENTTFCLARNIPTLMPCEVHSRIGYLVGSAPSYKSEKNIKILEEASKEVSNSIFVCKHSHDFLIEKGIIPFGCILLDPRPHVYDYLDNVNKDVIYFVASQVTPIVVKKLYESGVKVYLYHASVDSGEEELLNNLGVRAMMVAGGTTSMTRGIGLLNAIGFSHIKLFGLDSSYAEKPDVVHGVNKDKPAFEVNVAFRNKETGLYEEEKFWTDAELMLQCNDIEMILQEWLHISLENYSEGLLGEIFKRKQSVRPKFDNLISKEITYKIWIDEKKESLVEVDEQEEEVIYVD